MIPRNPRHSLESHPAAEALLTLRVTPRSSRNEVAGDSQGMLRVRLRAPPVEGRANEALIDFLAERLAISRRAVTLVGGQQSRVKRVRIEGLSEAEVRRRLGVCQNA